jgi:hypothetical protein
MDIMDLKQLESILVDVSSLTEDNDHTQARLKIAEEILKDKKLARNYQSIECLNSHYGYMEPNLGNIRNDLDRELYSKLESKFSAEISEKIINCL